MKSSMKALLCLMLAGTMMLSSCSSKQNDDSASADAGSTSTGDSGSVPVGGEFPLTEEPQSFSVMMAWHDLETSPADSYFTKQYQEMTNVEVEFITYPSDVWDEKRSIAFAGGDIADVIAGMDAYNIVPADLAKYGSQGLLLPINDYMDSSTYFKALLEEDATMAQLIKSGDGNIYAFPDINVCYHCNYYQKLWINTTWLKNVGKEMPTTTAEFKDVLTAFRDQDANGNGDASDEIPFMTPYNGWGSAIDGFLMNSFVYSDADNRLAWTEGDKVVFSPAQEGYREGLRYLNDLFNEDLITVETFTTDASTISKMQSGNTTPTDDADDTDGVVEVPVVGSWCMGYNGISAASEELREQFEIVSPLEGPDGFVTAANYKYYRDYTQGLFAITAAAENPNLIVAWVDWLYSEDGTRLKDMGIEGTHWEKAPEGSLSYGGGPAQYTLINSELSDEEYNDQGLFSIGDAFPAYRSRDYREGQVAPETGYADMHAPGAGDYQLHVRSNDYEAVAAPVDQTIPPLAVPEEKVSDYTRMKSELDSYVEENIAKFITGDLSLDEDWDAYLAGLESIGLTDYMTIVQDSYDAFLAQ